RVHLVGVLRQVRLGQGQGRGGVCLIAQLHGYVARPGQELVLADFPVHVLIELDEEVVVGELRVIEFLRVLVALAARLARVLRIVRLCRVLLVIRLGRGVLLVVRLGGRILLVIRLGGRVLLVVGPGGVGLVVRLLFAGGDLRRDVVVGAGVG